METTYHIEGITCQKCVRLITEALTEIEGVTQVWVLHIDKLLVIKTLLLILQVIVLKEQNAATVRLKEHFGSKEVLIEAIERLVNGKFRATEVLAELEEVTVSLTQVLEEEDVASLLTQLKQTVGINNAVIGT